MSDSRRPELLLGWVILGCILIPDFSSMGALGRIGIALPWLVVATVLAWSPLARRLRDRTRQVFAVLGATISLTVWGGIWLAVTALFGLFGGVVIAVWGVAGYVLAFLLFPSWAVARGFVTGAIMIVLAFIAGVAGELLLRTPAFERRYGGPDVERRFFRTQSDRLWSKNVFGFRSPYETVARRAGVLRIVTLGAGYTSALHIARTDSTWPALLEQELRREHPDRQLEVINMGRAGFTLRNMVELLDRLAWQFDPDLVIVAFEPNAARVSRPDFANAPISQLRLTLLPERFRRGWLASSALLHFAEYQYHLSVYEGGTYREYLPLFKPGATGYRETLDAVQQLGKSARMHGKPVVLLLFPDLLPGNWSAETDPFQPVYRRLLEGGREAGLTVLDLQPVFIGRRDDGRSWWATPYSSNPNERALDLAARTLAGLIVDCDLLSPPDAERDSRARAITRAAASASLDPPSTCPDRSAAGSARKNRDELAR
jgi:hypothetical protein